MSLARRRDIGKIFPPSVLNLTGGRVPSPLLGQSRAKYLPVLLCDHAYLYRYICELFFRGGRKMINCFLEIDLTSRCLSQLCIFK